MMRRDLCKEFNHVCVLQDIMVCLFSFCSFCMWVYSEWRVWNVPLAFQKLAWALTGELSGVWVVEMAGGFETEAGGSHQTSLEDEGEGGEAMPLALAWEKPRRWERDRRGSAGLRTRTQGDEGGRQVEGGVGRPAEAKEGQAQPRAGRVVSGGDGGLWEGHRALKLSTLSLAREL